MYSFGCRTDHFNCFEFSDSLITIAQDALQYPVIVLSQNGAGSLSQRGVNRDKAGSVSPVNTNPEMALVGAKLPSGDNTAE
jgi:hypothetical protein